MSLAGVVGLLLPGVALLGIATYRFAWPRPHATREPFLRISTERLTESGRATGAAISLDGKYIVHAIEEGGPQRLWLRHLATSSSVPITPSDEVEYWGLSFSPDGGHVYYVARKLAETDGRLLRIPTLGGVPQVVPIQAAISSTVSFAPDGRQMAYLGGPGALGSQLIVSSADGGDERVLATRQHPEPFSMHLSGPAWSPDGRIIVCAAAVPGSEGRYKQLVAVRADDGAQRPFGPRRWLNIGRLAWLPDGSGLLITANDQPWSPWQIWHVSYPAGDARRITNDVNDYRDLSLTADARTLIAVQAQRMGGLWVVPDGRHELARRITSEVGNYGGIAGISWTPDGKIVHRTRAAGHWDISMMEPDGSRQRRLTVDPAADLHPSVSLDGRYLVFSSNRRGSFDIWRTDLLGDQAVRLTGEGDEVYPRITPDGRWVIYQQGFRWFARLTLWKVPIEGGDPVALSPRFAMRPAISPDGKLVAFYHMEHGKWRLGVMSADGGNILKSFDDPGSLSRVVQWTPDGKSLAYVFGRGGVSNIWAQPLDGSAPAQITQFRSQEILDFSWSPDGRMLACVRGLDSSDLVRIGWE